MKQFLNCFGEDTVMENFKQIIEYKSSVASFKINQVYNPDLYYENNHGNSMTEIIKVKTKSKQKLQSMTII